MCVAAQERAEEAAQALHQGLMEARATHEQLLGEIGAKLSQARNFTNSSTPAPATVAATPRAAPPLQPGAGPVCKAAGWSRDP